MDFRSWKEELEPVLLAALLQSLNVLHGKPVERLDIGVFPWHGTLEISFLLSTDLANDLFSPEDIAAWPHYNLVSLSEGKSPETKALFQCMRSAWEQDTEMSEQFYRAVADVARSQSVKSAIQQFTKADRFILTLYDPDRGSSVNYCA